MNLMSNSTEIAGALIGEPSFADAMAAIEKAEDLLPKQKCHWCSSLRQMARYLNRPPSLIPTRIAAIGPAVRDLHPARLGVKPKTFANHRANAKAALLWFNRQQPDSGRKAPMDPRYRSLLGQVEDRYAKDMLSPFFRFLSAHDIRPDDVRSDHVESFQAYRRETSFGTVERSQHRALVRYWNASAARIPVWPKITFTEPPYVKGFTGPAWEDFPQGLRDDIDAYCERIGKRHKTISGKIFPRCKQSTIDMRRREIVAAVRAAVAAGIPLEELKSLRDLLRPDRVETLLDYYWEKNGEKPSLYTIDLASKLLALAHSEDLTTVEIEGLDEIQNRPRAVPLYRSHREEPEADPPDRPQRRVAGGGAASAKADGRGPHQRQDEAVQGRRHGATRHRHSDPDSGAGADAEPRLDSHRHQSDQTRRPGSALHAGLPGL